MLATVRRVKLDLLTNTLTLEYVSGRQNTSRVAMVFATPEAADAAFTKVWRRLGKSFELAPHKPDPWAVARVPVAFMAGILVATAAVALVLGGAEDVSVPPGVGRLAGGVRPRRGRPGRRPGVAVPPADPAARAAVLAPR